MPPCEHKRGIQDEAREAPAGDRGTCFLHGEPGSEAPSSPSSPIANEPKYEKRWLDTLSVPLSMARISRYKAGTEKSRSTAFEVLALDGVSTGILQFYTAQDSADWLRAVSANIRDLTLQNIVHMGWVNERLQGADSSQTFVWLADNCWLQANLYLGLHDFDTEDQRPCCFSVMVGHGRSHRFSVELGSELAAWEKSFQRATFMEVQRMGVWLADNCWLQANLYLGLHDFDTEDQRPCCFSVMVGHGRSHRFSVELGSELAAWEKSFQRATFMEVQRMG
ncbi:PREDICTED: gamma-2-syntrophin-like, partial [Galeopterus variegatus]|uniref:Gamma-2-syntrophin-like n=1 Tax=Galeopterus variegatus TaxID=482537 RepID=A0ABM0SCC6_GALVR